LTVLKHPTPGTIIRVDLTEGFRTPEMGKRRPAIVLSPPLRGRSQLCAIVPLSTSEPRKFEPWHYRLELDPPLPSPYDKPVMWAKCDMVQTVAFHRLRLLYAGKDWYGERCYDVRVLGADQLDEVRACVRSALGL
jgi:mRNA interferase MazF